MAAAVATRQQERRNCCSACNEPLPRPRRPRRWRRRHYLAPASQLARSVSALLFASGKHLPSQLGNKNGARFGALR